MTRRFGHRLRWRRDEVVATLENTDPAVVARSFAYLFGLGALLVAVAPALPGRQLTHPVLVDGAAGVAALISLAVLSSYDRTPDDVLRSLPAFGTVLVTTVLLGARPDAVAPYALLYFWVVLSAFYFFGRNVGLLHLLLVVLCFGGILATIGVAQAPMLGLMSLGTLVVTGVMLALLRERADTLILSLGAAARTDALTGALNRRAFDEGFGDELARAERTQRKVALLVVDIDEFKVINDRFGHQTGDRVLQRLARALSKGRTIDKVGRMGGDEFAVMLPETDALGALEVAGRIRHALEGAPDGAESVVSVGIATWADHGRTADELHEAADCALYAAKALGGNQATVYNATMRRAAAPSR